MSLSTRKIPTNDRNADGASGLRVRHLPGSALFQHQKPPVMEYLWHRICGVFFTETIHLDAFRQNCFGPLWSSQGVSLLNFVLMVVSKADVDGNRRSG